ncbi:MAG: DUF2243 domain-containing protein [Paracoccus sp. (in: a-proteobacteria)]
MTGGRPFLPGAVLGFALGGFFDGILLHQILQWHHLLSLVPGITDMRQQIMWDGYFHALMYVFALVGIAALWHQRGPIGSAPRSYLWGPVLVGFGVWHGVDAVLSHWVLGIHRIKDDSDFPLIWDLGWLLVFGLVPLLVGLHLRGPGGGPSGRSGIAGRPVAALAILTVGMGAWALVPPPDMPLTAIVFRGSVDEGDISAALDAVGASVVWRDVQGGVAIVDLQGNPGWGLYRHGALLVSGSGVPAGCFSWSRA